MALTVTWDQWWALVQKLVDEHTGPPGALLQRELNKAYRSRMAALDTEIEEGAAFWLHHREESSMPETFEGLVPGRHVFYEHPSDGALCAIVAKVNDKATGNINVALLLPTGMWVNMRNVDADPSVGGPAVERAVEGYLHHRWRWMFAGQATSADPKFYALPGATGAPPEPARAMPESGEPGAPVVEAPPVNEPERAGGATIPPKP